MSEPEWLAGLRQDQRRRWSEGECVQVEVYLEREPSLRTDPDALLDLIYNEILLRQEAGDTPTFAEYHQRFGELGEQIQLLFEVHEAIERAMPGALPPTRIEQGPPIACHVEVGTLPGYEILSVLGRGGMGIVYKARQTSLKRLVALKMILAGAQASPEELSRFRIEAEAVARLQHPNIVQIYEVGEHNGSPYFALELVNGGSLHKRLAGAPQPPRPAAELMAVLARAMHHAHQRGIVHRDLKPANILLSNVKGQMSNDESPTRRADGAGHWTFDIGLLTPKITDFGLAKLLDAAIGQTPTDAFLGTPSYAAPEQAIGKSRATGASADIYSLGAILYELLTGRPPFRGTTLLETLEQVCTREPVPPRQLQPTVPRDLETISLKCLRKEPSSRYATAEDFAADLHRFLAGEPIRARPVSLLERGIKWARRRPAAAALLAVTSTLVTGASLALLGRTLHEQQRLANLRQESAQLLHTGQLAFAGGDWASAEGQFSRILDRVRDEPALIDLHLQAEEWYADTRRRRVSDERFRDFTQQRDEALFQGINSMTEDRLLTGVDPATSRSLAKIAAQRALDHAGVPKEATEAWAPEASFTESQRNELATSCYALLLMLADVAARDISPNQAPDQRAALRLIERAGRLFAPTQAYHRRRAHYLERLGDITEAQRERQLAEQLPLTGPLDHFLLGDEQYQRGRLVDAQQSFSNAVSHDLPSFWADFYLAMCHLHRQQWDQARAELTVCCMQRRDFVWARLLRGYVLRELTAFDAAQGEFRAAEEILIRQPNTAAQFVLHVNRGSLWLRQENLPEAEADFQRAETFLDDHPDQLARYVLYVNRGVLRLHQGKLDEAHAELQRAVALHPDQYLAYLNRASVFEKQQNAAAAAEQFHLALQRKPPALVLALYHAERGRELCQAHQYKACVAACQQALKHRGDCAQAHGILGQAFLELHRYQDAADAFDRYLQCDGPPKADIYRGRGQARMDLKDYQGAADDYSRVLEQEPEDGAALTHRGWAYFFAEDRSQAARDFERAIPLNRVNKDGWIGRGLCRVEKGDYRAAVADAREALRQKTDRPEMLLNLACIFARAVACALDDPTGKAPQQLAADYRNQALDLLDEALQRALAEDQGTFWRDAVAKETWLDAIRATERFRQLQQRYSGR